MTRFMLALSHVSKEKAKPQGLAFSLGLGGFEPSTSIV